MRFLATRAQHDELMDDPAIGFAEFAQTLREIERINRRTGAYRPTLQAVRRLIPRAHPATEPIRILDIGFGNGDVLRRIAAWAQTRGLTVELSGVDLNPWSQQAAQRVTPAALPIEYVTSNIFDFIPHAPYHIIINSLFTHHLSNTDVVRIMQWMTAQARWGWFINDLHRHRIPYYFIRSYVRVCGYNRLVRHDAPLSVARAFTRTDWQQYIQRSGLPPQQLRISWHWPFRYGVTYTTPTHV